MRIAPREDGTSRAHRFFDGPGPLLIVMLLGELLIFRKTFGDFRVREIGLQGDSHLFTWAVDYFASELRHGRFPWTVRSISPQLGGVNYFSDTTAPGVGLLLAPFTWKYGAVAATNAGYLLAPLVTALVTRRLARELRVSNLGASAAGLSLAASPYMAAHMLGHLNLVHLWIVPLCALGMLQLFRGDKVRGTIWTAVGIGGGLWFAAELPALVIVLAILGIVSIAVTQRSIEPVMRSVTALAPAAVLAVILGFPVLWGTFVAPNHFTGDVHQGSNVYISDLVAPVFPVENQMFSTAPTALRSYPGIPTKVPFQANAAEWGGYLSIAGVTLLAVRLIPALRRRAIPNGQPANWAKRPDSLVPFAFLDVIGLSAFVLSLGPSLHVYGKDTGIALPWAIVDRVQVFRSILPIRFSAIVALWFALSVAWVIERRRDLPNWVTVTALVGLVMQLPMPTFPVHIAGPKQAIRATVPLDECRKATPGRKKPRVLILPREQSVQGLSWLRAFDNNFELVRTRWFMREDPVDGIVLPIDQWFEGNGDLDTSLEELSTAKTDCIVVVTNTLTPEQIQRVDELRQRWSVFEATGPTTNYLHDMPGSNDSDEPQTLTIGGPTDRNRPNELNN